MSPADLTDDEVAALLDAAAPDVSTHGVVEAVVDRTARRRRARARRRAGSAIGVAAAAVLVTVGLVAWASTGDDTVDIAVPSSDPTVPTTVAAGSGRVPDFQSSTVPGDGDSVTPLATDGATFWLVRGSSSVDFGSGQRTISRWSTDLRRSTITFVEGIPTLAVVAFDRLWVVVVEPAEEGPPEWRLKQIRPDDGLLLSSTAIPLTAKPLNIAIGTADPTGGFLAISTAVETVTVSTADRSVTSVPNGGQPPVESPPVTLPEGFTIEGTDLVARKEAS